MTQVWFDPNFYAWIPGTAYGVMAVALAGFVGWLVPQGRARNTILRTWFGLWAVALALLVAGLVALAVGQPWGVWFGLLLPGAIGALVVGGNTYVIRKRYREVEERRLAAKDLG